MSPSESFARQQLKKNALTALYDLRKEMGESDHFRQNIKLTLKLFETLISLILLYSSEIKALTVTKKWIRIPQNKFLRWLLGVNKYCI